MAGTRTGLILTTVLVIASSALACLWDRDTLAAEARGRPGVAEVLVGWIDRWPDEVYEVRLERVAAAVDDDPAALELYDDAGVACDRLGRHDEAIAWMERKRTSLDALATTDDEHEYRYHANLGTFYVHRWIHGGADRDDLGDVERAEEHLQRAIAINPEAHFGREVVQLRLVELLRGHRVTRARHALEPLYSDEDDPEVRYTKILNGLVGLIELGNAWESLDVYWLVYQHAAGPQVMDGSFSALASFRVEDLHDAGRESLLNAALDREDIEYPDMLVDWDTYVPLFDDDLERVRAWYDEARTAADARNTAREAYILGKLDAGEHPDDAGYDVFFAGWSERELPAMPDGISSLVWRESIWPVVGLICAFIALVAGIAAYAWFRARRRRAAVS